MSQPDIVLYTLGDAFGMRNVSPFCFKVEMALKFLDMPFEMRVENNPRKAPKGKLPFMDIDGTRFADSEVILAELDRLSGGKLFGQLDARSQALGLGLTRLAEEHLYWFIVASRWLDPEWFPNVVEGFFHIAPAPVRPLVASIARRQVRQTLHLHGLGRHSPSEQEGFVRRDFQALQDAVSDEGFLFGAEPCVHDFAVAALAAGAYYHQPPTWITPIANDYPGLLAFVERVQAHVGIHARA